jgi:hypothetical protein
LTRHSDAAFGIYLDDCAFDYELVAVLASGSYRVVTPKDAALLGAPDDAHLAYAAGAGLALLTKNPRDFRALHLASGSSAAAPSHAGILVVYQDNNPSKGMAPRDILAAIDALLTAAIPIAGEIHELNHWRR